MKTFVISSWNSIMDNRYNPLRYLDLASQHYLMQVLGWMWSMIFSLSFLSIVYFGAVWLAHLLLIGGLFMTVSVFKNAEKNSPSEQSTAKPQLSHSSPCLWQLDKEA